MDIGEDLEGEQLTIENLRRIIANPFYCINMYPDITIPHEPLISEETWIKSAKRSIEENGAEVFLKELLENLKGNSV
jgi:hypothetical protein